MRDEGTEKTVFEARIRELAEKAERYIPGYTHFLTPQEQTVAARILSELGADCFTFFFGGCDGSERNRLFALPDYLAFEGECNLKNIVELVPDIVAEAVVPIKIQGSGYKRLTHRDYLGSVLGMGIERSVVGDIAVLDDCSAVVFCDAKISEYILNELKRVGNDAVKVVPFDMPENFCIKKEFKSISDTVASERFDCVVAALCGISREKAREIICSGAAELNYFAEEKPDRAVSAESIISVRGYGKFAVVSLSEPTKKGRLRLLANKYI